MLLVLFLGQQLTSLVGLRSTNAKRAFTIIQTIITAGQKSARYRADLGAKWHQTRTLPAQSPQEQQFVM